VGGAASAPIVASAFHPSLATVGVLLAVFGYAVGTVGAILCTVLMQLASAAYTELRFKMQGLRFKVSGFRFNQVLLCPVSCFLIQVFSAIFQKNYPYLHLRKLKLFRHKFAFKKR